MVRHLFVSHHYYLLQFVFLNYQLSPQLLTLSIWCLPTMLVDLLVLIELLKFNYTQQFQ